MKIYPGKLRFLAPGFNSRVDYRLQYIAMHVSISTGHNLSRDAALCTNLGQLFGVFPTLTQRARDVILSQLSEARVVY